MCRGYLKKRFDISDFIIEESKAAIYFMDLINDHLFIENKNVRDINITSSIYEDFVLISKHININKYFDDFKFLHFHINDLLYRIKKIDLNNLNENTVRDIITFVRNSVYDDTYVTYEDVDLLFSIEIYSNVDLQKNKTNFYTRSIKKTIYSFIELLISVLVYSINSDPSLIFNSNSEHSNLVRRRDKRESFKNLYEGLSEAYLKINHVLSLEKYKEGINKLNQNIGKIEKLLNKRYGEIVHLKKHGYKTTEFQDILIFRTRDKLFVSFTIKNYSDCSFLTREGYEKCKTLCGDISLSDCMDRFGNIDVYEIDNVVLFGALLDYNLGKISMFIELDGMDKVTFRLIDSV